MIRNIADFKKRTLVESNTLKSFILSASKPSFGLERDDILIHDNQMANSVTLNTILSNYIVNVRHAWSLLDNATDRDSGDSYFRIVEGLDEAKAAKLPDSSRLILDVSDGDATFKSRELVHSVKALDVPDGTVGFVNLDAVWYCLVSDGEEGGSDSLELAPDSGEGGGLNNFISNPNPFGSGVNPFNSPMRWTVDSQWGASFNDFARENGLRIHRILENQFNGNAFDSSSGGGFGKALQTSRYLVCLGHGFYGLRPEWDSRTSEFLGFTATDIGALFPNLDGEAYSSGGYTFVDAGFHIVGGLNTLFVSFTSPDGSSHYIYLNDDTYDGVYGFSELRHLVVDGQMVVEPSSVFSKVVQMKTLDGNIAIALTDYGFWDLEPNATGVDEVFSYRWDLKDYARPVGGFNGTSEKLVLPTTVISETDKVVEANEVWRLDPASSMYSRHGMEVGQDGQCDVVSDSKDCERTWPARAGQAEFTGATQDFAIYAGNGEVGLLAAIGQRDFNQILLSNPDLTSAFVDWMFDSLACGEPAPVGERFLMENHAEMVGLLDREGNSQNRRFGDVGYSVSASDGVVHPGFSSIKGIAERCASAFGLPTPTTLCGMCTSLDALSSSGPALSLDDWLLSSSNALVSTLKDHFREVEYPNNLKDGFVSELVDALVESFPPLTYFKSYLSEHLAHDFAVCPEPGISHSGGQVSVGTVRDFVLSRVPTALVLGGYTAPGRDEEPTNACYPGVDSYIKRTNAALRRQDVKDIMASPSGILDEAREAVKSMPFFSEHRASYASMVEALSDPYARESLFRVRRNVEFAEVATGVVSQDGVASVSWEDSIGNWLFSNDRTDEERLKALVRTQLFRPLFFDPTNHDTFTSDGTKYRCETRKSYINHDGVEKPLAFLPGTWEVDAVASGLGGATGYDFAIQDISFDLSENELRYAMNHQEVPVSDGKFTCFDIEFYVASPNGGVPEKVYFNRWRNQTQETGDVTPVEEDGSFLIGGKAYGILDGKVVTVNATETAESGQLWPDGEFSQELVDGRMFNIQGVWYIVQLDGTGAITGLLHSRLDDFALDSIDIDPSTGHGSLDGIELAFSPDWTKVDVLKRHVAVAIDRLVWEWCEYDDEVVSIDSDRIFEWHLANEVLHLKNGEFASNPDLLAGLLALGSGKVYGGLLDSGSFRLGIENEMRGGVAITRGVLTKESQDGTTEREDIGVLFDDQLEVDSGKVLVGGISDGLYVPTGTDVVILKDNSLGRRNNCNAIWLGKSVWDSCWSLVRVGKGTEDGDTGDIQVVLDNNGEGRIGGFMMRPTYTSGSKEDGSVPTSYTIEVEEGEDGKPVSFSANLWLGKVHLVVNGDRYIVEEDGEAVPGEDEDPSSKRYKVSRLEFVETDVHTVDFTTQFGSGNLLESLFGNLVDFMEVEVAQGIADDGPGGPSTIQVDPSSVVPAPLGTCVDMFSDSTSTLHYLSAKLGTVQKGDPECLKFQEVFKNHSHDADTSKVRTGHLYEYLNGLVEGPEGVFGDEPPSDALTLVDRPSVEVRRVVSSGAEADRFSCSAWFDIHIRLKKGAFSSGANGTFAIADATVKEVKCTASFTPGYVGGFGTDVPMTCEVAFSVEPGVYGVEYSQVMHKVGGKTRTKAVEPGSATVALDGFSTGVRTVGLSGTAEELVSEALPDLFGPERLRELALRLNNEVFKPLGRRIVVDQKVLRNAGSEDGVWGIDVLPGGVLANEDIPVAQVGEVKSKSFGKTIIDGRRYAVQATPNQLREIGGAHSLDIACFDAHKTAVSTGYDSEGNIQHVLAALGNELVSQQELEASFVIQQNPTDQTGKLARFTDGKYRDVMSEDLDATRDLSGHALSLSEMADSGLVDWCKAEVLSSDGGDGEGFSERVAALVSAVGGMDGSDYVYLAKEVDDGHGNMVAAPVDEGVEVAIGSDLSDSGDFDIYGAGQDGVSEHDYAQRIEEWTGSGNPDQTSLLGVKFKFTGFAQRQVEGGEEVPDGQEPEMEWNGWLGSVGGFSVDFTGLDTQTPTASIDMSSVKPCVEVDTGTGPARLSAAHGDWSLPGQNFMAVTVYTPIGIAPDSLVCTVGVPEQDGEPPSSDPKPLNIQFKVKAKVQRYMLYLKAASDYAQNGLYWDGTHERLEHALSLVDIKGLPVGGLGYAFMQFPMGIGTALDYDTLMAGEFRQICIGLSGTQVVGPGRHCPSALRVLPAEGEGSAFKENGDIYDRYYATEQLTYSGHADISASDLVVGMSTLDLAASRSSMHELPTDSTYLKLVNLSEGGIPLPDENPRVPENMRKGVKDLVARMLGVDDNHLKSVLSQIQIFLELVDRQLKQSQEGGTWDISDICSLCKFKYDALVSFPSHTAEASAWKSPSGGLFGWERQSETYAGSVSAWNQHLKDGFRLDFSSSQDNLGPSDISDRDYRFALLGLDGLNAKVVELASANGLDVAGRTSGTVPGALSKFKETALEALLKRMDVEAGADHDIVHDIFNSHGLDGTVRYMNYIQTPVSGDVLGMFAADGFCHLFVRQGTGTVQWRKFACAESDIHTLVAKKAASGGGRFTYDPPLQTREFPINPNGGWLFRMANRNLSGDGGIQTAYLVNCISGSTELWYLSSIDRYLFSVAPHELVDVAFEANGNAIYAAFKGDNHLYRYDNAEGMADSQKRIQLKRENATLKLETMHSASEAGQLGESSSAFSSVCVDYGVPEGSGAPSSWRLNLHGSTSTTQGGESRNDRETWHANPGQMESAFKLRNAIAFGDSLFNEDQLRFQNVSKNKEMFDIIDVDEVDGCYYGLFKDGSQSSKAAELGFDTYTVFKTASSKTGGGIVQRLPYIVATPSLYRSADPLYSLFVLALHPDSGKESGFRLRLQEISVPDADPYSGRVVELQDIMEQGGVDVSGLVVKDISLSNFKTGSAKGSFFVLDNKDRRFHLVGFSNVFKQLSIDDTDSLKAALEEAFSSEILQRHIQEMHQGDSEMAKRMDAAARKVNMGAEGFTPFDLVPAEFGMTQDVGVIPDSKVDDTDETPDHRADSVLVSTDILWTDGMVAQTDTNPGIVTAAVSNPATVYDDDNVFTKAQRNPSLEGTEFYDFINDQDGNVLMDLYSIPFIYRVNSNNTYDLYINVPTTRTKYLNRLAGSLKDDGTSLVQKGDARTRRNFLDESLPNNLDESTTRLRVFIDRKYISIGDIGLVEISGNSIPLQIYRDVPNNGLYDSIALESRWDGEVNELNEPDKDINKVMLEFECYGTDSQSIHIQGRTLVNRALDGGKYMQQSSAQETEGSAIQWLTLTFDPMGGTVGETSRTVEIGGLVGELPTTEREGFVFDGWWTSPKDGMGVRMHDDTVATNEYGALYAHWIPVLKSIEIYGDNDLAPGEVSVYACVAQYGDNSNGKVTPTWACTSGSSDATGRFTAQSDWDSGQITIQATYGWRDGTEKKCQFAVNPS